MNKRILLGIILSCLSAAAFSSAVSINAIIESVEQHPDVVAKAHATSSQRLQTSQLRAESGPQVNFSTKGNFPIARKLNTNFYRASIDDRSYLDGVISGSMTLYDFGESDAKIAANTALELSAEYDYEDTREAILLKLLNLVSESQRLEAIGVSLDSSNSNINEAIAKVKQQYRSGVGTIDEVREVELSRLDVESQLQLLKIKQQEVLNNLRQEFGLSSSALENIYAVAQSLSQSSVSNESDLLSSIINNSATLVSARTRETHTAEVSAIEQQMLAIEAARKPQVGGLLTATLYDITRGLDEYQIGGGINVALPLFDSGRSRVQMQSALHNIRIEDDKLRAILFEKQLTLEELIQQISSLEASHSASLIKQEELNAKLANLELKQQATNGSLVARVQTQMELDKLERDLLNYDYVIIQSNLKYLRLNETLLGEFGKLEAAQ